MADLSSNNIHSVGGQFVAYYNNKGRTELVGTVPVNPTLKSPTGDNKTSFDFSIPQMTFHTTIDGINEAWLLPPIPEPEVWLLFPHLMCSDVYISRPRRFCKSRKVRFWNTVGIRGIPEYHDRTLTVRARQ